MKCTIFYITSTCISIIIKLNLLICDANYMEPYKNKIYCIYNKNFHKNICIFPCLFGKPISVIPFYVTG